MTIDERTLDARLDALPRSSQVPESVWQSVASRLNTAPRHRRPLATIAALAAALALAVLVVREPDPAAPGAPVIRAEAQAMRQQAEWQGLDEGAIENGGLAEARRVNQEAIGELERAIESDPGNPLLIDLLAQARLRQSELVYLAAEGGTAAIAWNI